MDRRISVIIPVFNRAELLPRALSSAVRQDHPEKEIIVVDDGSTDGSAEVAERLLAASGVPYQVIRLGHNGGVSRARNCGIRRAQGAYLSFLDSDDFCESSMLSSMFSRTEQGGRVDLVFCGYRKLFAETGATEAFPLNERWIKDKPTDAIAVARLFNRFEPALSSLFRRELLVQQGIFFNESCYAGEDGEFFLKAIVKSGRIASVPSVPYIYVQHKTPATAERSPRKKIDCYRNNSLALARSLRYVIENTDSPRLRAVANNYLLPLVLQRFLSHAAMCKEEHTFFKVARNRGCLKKMLASFRVILAKPEIFFKSLALWACPGRYYRHYSRKFDPTPSTPPSP